MKVIAMKQAKTKDRRVLIHLLEMDNKELAISIKTRRLTDKKKRHIKTSEEIFTIVTAASIRQLLDLIFEEHSDILECYGPIEGCIINYTGL